MVKDMDDANNRYFNQVILYKSSDIQDGKEIYRSDLANSSSIQSKLHSIDTTKKSICGELIHIPTQILCVKNDITTISLTSTYRPSGGDKSKFLITTLAKFSSGEEVYLEIKAESLLGLLMTNHCSDGIIQGRFALCRQGRDMVIVNQDNLDKTPRVKKTKTRKLEVGTIYKSKYDTTGRVFAGKVYSCYTSIYDLRSPKDRIRSFVGYRETLEVKEYNILIPIVAGDDFETSISRFLNDDGELLPEFYDRCLDGYNHLLTIGDKIKSDSNILDFISEVFNKSSKSRFDIASRVDFSHELLPGLTLDKSGKYLSDDEKKLIIENAPSWFKILGRNEDEPNE